MKSHNKTRIIMRQEVFANTPSTNGIVPQYVQFQVYNWVNWLINESISRYKVIQNLEWAILISTIYIVHNKKNYVNRNVHSAAIFETNLKPYWKIRILNFMRSNLLRVLFIIFIHIGFAVCISIFILYISLCFISCTDFYTVYFNHKTRFRFALNKILINSFRFSKNESETIL